MSMMAEMKQGCIRFQWGRDWNVRDYASIEEAADLMNVPYNMYLSNKTNLLKSMLHKDQQMTLMDSVIKKLEGQRRRSNDELNSSQDRQSKTID